MAEHAILETSIIALPSKFEFRIFFLITCSSLLLFAQIVNQDENSTRNGGREIENNN